MPLVRVGIDLDREIALDWFVLQTQLHRIKLFGAFRGLRGYFTGRK